MLTGCSESFLDPDPQTMFEPETVFSTENGIKSVLAICDRQLKRNYVSEDSREMIALPTEYTFSDLMVPSATDKSGLLDNVDNLLRPNSDQSDEKNLGRTNSIYFFWRQNFEGVRNANTILSFIGNVPMDETLKNEYIGRAYFHRAYRYYSLVFQFGHVPLLTKLPEVPKQNYRSTHRDAILKKMVADMEFATPDVVIDGMRERLDKRIFGYTRVFEKSYYEAFSAWCQRRYGWTFDRKELVMSNGIIPALYEMVEYICKPDEKVLFLTPSYAYFKYAADFSKRGYVCSDLHDEDGYYTIDFDDLAKKAADEKTTLFILCNPHNPSGRIWTEEELKKMAEIIEKNNMWVISDEIHCDLIRCDKKHIPMGKVMPDYKRLITCMAPSKTFNLAGMMISNVIIRDEGLKEIWLGRHYNFDNPLSIAAAQAAYEKGEPWLEELRAYLDENFRFTGEYLKEHLPKAKYRVSEATYLAWVDLNAYFEPDEHLPLFFAYKAGVLLEGGNMFVQNSDGFIRLNLACPKATLAEGLRRICEAVNTKHTEKYLGEK